MHYRVNLLAWRERRREEHKRRFVGIIFFAVLVAVGIQWTINLHIQSQQRLQQSRQDYLTEYITRLDERIASMKIAQAEHVEVLARLRSVEALQMERDKTSDFMTLLQDMIPAGVYVDKIKMGDREVEIAGIGDSYARITAMLDSLESSGRIADLEMHSIALEKERFGMEFQAFEVSFVFLNAASAQENEESKRD